MMRQFAKEMLSDFLTQLEKSLTKVVQKGGLMSQSMDRARLEQLIRGASAESDLMLLQLRLRERKAKPPGFLEFLNEIKTAEENELARRRIGMPVKSLILKTDSEVDSDVVNKLRAELQELKLKMRKDSSKMPADSMRTAAAAEKQEKKREATCGDPEGEEKRGYLWRP